MAEPHIDSDLDVILALCKARRVLWPDSRPRWWPAPRVRRPSERWQRSARQRSLEPQREPKR